MKITTNAILIVCLILLAETMSFATEAVVSEKMPTNAQQDVDVSKVRRNQKLRAWVKVPTATKQVVEVSEVQRQQKLRAWVDSIKPAAGQVEPETPPGNEYWRQSVRRENRGSMHE